MFSVIVSSLVTFILVTNVTRAQFSLRDARASGLNLLGQNPCVSKQTCSGNIYLSMVNNLNNFLLFYLSECLQTPTCAWCSQPGYASSDGSPLPRCNQEEFYVMSSRWGHHHDQCTMGTKADMTRMFSRAYWGLSDHSKSLQTEPFVFPSVKTPFILYNKGPKPPQNFLFWS